MKQAISPFKFLDSYKQEDGDVFFGRDKEIDELYNALSGVKHLLIYGPSGAGKTSLVECGLRNQFSDADWFALTIRRRMNMTASVFACINDVLEEKMELDINTYLPKGTDLSFGTAIENLFTERYQPIYLLFDQFEELLILGSNKEKEDFFSHLNDLIRYKVPCRVILIMREEFIGHLSEFEHLCSSIFQHRFRLEKMGRSNVKDVIFNILVAPRYNTFFDVGNAKELTESILSKLPDEKREIELTHVQVFLSELWERANESNTNGILPKLHKALIRNDDNLEGVLDSFLKGQLTELEIKYSDKAPLELLAGMISERHTKLQLSESELLEDLEKKGVVLKEPLHNLLKDLEQRRIVRTLKADERTQYEISHDLLALVVGQNLTEEIKMREKAEDIYKVYLEREGYFVEEDMDYMRPYQQYKPYPQDLNKRIEESKAYRKAEQKRELKEAQARAEKEQKLRGGAEQNAKRATQRTRIASVVALFAIIAAGLAYSFFNQAQQQTTKAEEKQEEAEEQKRIAFAEKTTSDSLRVIAENQLSEITKQKGIILEEKENTQRALNEATKKEKARLAEEQKRIDAEKKNIATKIAEIQTLIKVNDTVEAKKLLRDALKLFPNHPDLLKLKNKLN